MKAENTLPAVTPLVNSAGYRMAPSLLAGLAATDISPPRVDRSHPAGTPTWKPS